MTVTLTNGDTMEVAPGTPVGRDGHEPGLASELNADSDPVIVYEPMRECWTPYEPWMRDVLADDARVSWDAVSSERRSTWSGLRYFAHKDATGWMEDYDLRVHPDDVPEQSQANRALLDELMRSGRRRNDPISMNVLELLKQPQTTAALGLTDEQMEATMKAYDRGDDDAVMRILNRSRADFIAPKESGMLRRGQSQ